MALRLAQHLLRTAGTLGRRLRAAVAGFVRPAACPAQADNLTPGGSPGRLGGRPARRPEFTGRLRGFGPALLLLPLAAALFLPLPSAARAATYGTPIDNIAYLGFKLGGASGTAESNLVSFMVRAPAVIEFLMYAPSTPGAEAVPVAETLYQSSGGLVPISQPPPILDPTVPLVVSPVFSVGQTFFLRVTDLDQNLDRSSVETILVTVICQETGDSETLRLTETGPNTGVFAGYLPSAATGSVTTDGRLLVVDEARLLATYTDPYDMVETVTTTALIDPFGIIFDSQTGQPVDGATVSLVDALTGLPALVYGDDGVSIYQPDGTSTGSATIVTGGSATDAAGNLYQMPPGGFRFPYLLPGTYRLLVTPPAGYVFPSNVSDDRLLAVYPDATLTIGSRGESFSISTGPAVRIDIPVDPRSGGLWLAKEVNQEEASVGDFLQYRLTVENTSPQAEAPAVRITDRLPAGFRYQKGSTRISDSPAADPEISEDGRTLIFRLGNLTPASTTKVAYVTEVAAGARIGEAINQAQATDALGTLSNRAQAQVTIREVFFRNEAFLLGRVLKGGCSKDDTAMAGIAGVRLYLEDGSYVVTDEEGRYHFEGVTPGVHVVQVDTDTLPFGYEMLACEQSTQFAGRNFSQFVDLQGGTLWRVNFYAAPKPPLNGDAGLKMGAQLDDNLATFRLGIAARTVPIANVRVTVMLPAGAQYLLDSAFRDGRPLGEPEGAGDTVTFRFPELDAGQQTEIVFRAEFGAALAVGELPAKALLQFDSPSAKNQRAPAAETRFRAAGGIPTGSEEVRLHLRFPELVADLQETDRAMLAQLAATLKNRRLVRLEMTGHTDSRPIAPHNHKLFADNQALSLARAHSVAEFLKAQLGLPDEALTVRGAGESMPIADNIDETGRAQNRRVELFVVSETAGTAPALELTVPSSPEKTVATVGLSPAEGAPRSKRIEPPAAVKPPKFDRDWLATVPLERRIAWPEAGFVPSIPNIEVMVQYRRGEQVELRLNDEPVSTFNFDETKPVPNSDMVVAGWAGIDLVAGRNRLEARVRDAAGNEVTRLQRDIWFVTMAHKLEFFPEKSHLVADGLRPPTFAVRLTDRDGHPLHPGRQLQFQASAPYAPLHEAEDRTLARTAAYATFETGVDGLAYLQLEPTTSAGEVRINIMLPEGAQELRAWLKPVPRDWILVGFAEGTVGYNTISGNQVSLDEADIDEHGFTDGRVKFFAKGAVKGEWLLTLAYDSDKPDLDGNSLQQAIDPDTYYPLYGDETLQGYEAASASDIYVKIEREQFYAMFGDMQTGLTQTELSQYSRSLNGLKVEQNGERFAYTFFAADTKQAFVKDEIRGDGTSGRYTLSQNDLVINSEEVVIQTRDRFHNERIVKEEMLSRHLDYDIDFNAGTLFFKRPVPSRDEGFNPVFIVVRYETMASSSTNLNYGGRAAVRSADGRVEVGGSYVHEENGSGEGDLVGTDVTVRLGPKTTLRAEAAGTEVTSSDRVESDRTGGAYLVEIEHSDEQLVGRTWFRRQDSHFGLGQQNEGSEGMRSYGAEGSYLFNPQWGLRGEAYHEDNLATDAKRDVATVEATYRAERYGLLAGLRGARDRFADGPSKSSQQLLLGGDWSTPDRRLNLRATHEQSLGGSNENIDFPSRTLLGADYRLTERISLFAEQELTWGDTQDTQGTRVGITAAPWQGGEMHSTVERRLNENEQRMFALFGLGQTWQLNKNWSVDLAAERSYTFQHKETGERVNARVPLASGEDEDFTSVSAGAAYRTEKWTWWNRLETRQGEKTDQVGISTDLVGELRPGTAASARLMAFITESSAVKTSEVDVRLGMAYRPDRSKWIILERLDVSLLSSDGSGDAGDNDSWRIINHLHANVRASRSWQTSIYYGIKYVKESFDGDHYDGVTDMLAIETRYNLNERWDVGLHAALRHSWNSNQFDYSLGGDVGCLMMTNAWVSAGYNVVGFEDDDFSDANYTADGPFVRMRMKFDQQSVKEAAEWLNK